ncbi:hypothetical protein BsWGS_03913 [Bradybaena similaris]
MQNYRDPPPYPGHSKQVYTNQPGFRQSYSGSETSTDVSLSSTENLATSQRQEPQGEETQSSFNYQLDFGNAEGSNYSILERLGMPPSAIDSAGKFSDILTISASTFHQDRGLQLNQSAGNSTSDSLGFSTAHSPLYAKGHVNVPQWQLGNNIHQQHEITTSLGEYTSPSSRSQAFSLFSYSAPGTVVKSRDAAGNVPSISLSNRTGSGSGLTGLGLTSSVLPSSSSHQYLSPRVPPVSTYHHPHPYVNTHWTADSGDSTCSSHSSHVPYHTSSPLMYSQPGVSSVAGSGTISHSSHDTSQTSLNSLPPPPQYPGTPKDTSSVLGKITDIWTSRSYEAMDKTDSPGSHSDLRLCASSPGIFMHDVKVQNPQSRSANSSADDSDQVMLASRAGQMVDMLTSENRTLREELALASVKVARLQKFEMELQKVHESHEALVKSSQKQEALWMAMKRKLETKIQSLEAQKTDGGSSHMSRAPSDADYRFHLAEKDAMISKLLSQNQELSLSRDRLEEENAQLSMSVAEHRAHVDILENALLNAQSRVMAMEEGYRKKQSQADKVEQLQNALKALQTASEKQEKKEKELRVHLEKEIEMYRAQEKAGAAKKSEHNKDDVRSTGMLKKMLGEKDARILQLEADLAGTEQKYIKEVTLRGLQLEQAVQSPKDVRFSTLENSSSEMEKLIDEAKTEKLKHMEELHESHKSVAELEAKVKQLQSQLAEKEAMVKVFQRSPLAMARSSSLHALCHSPLHSPHASLISQYGYLGSSQVSESASSGNYREYATIRHVKSGSSSAVELEHKKSMEEDLLSKVQNLNTANDSDDEGKLFHV